MKTTLLNPCDYDVAMMDLCKSELPQATLNLAINLLRDARNLAEVKLAKDIAKLARKTARQAEAKELKEYREWALNN